MKVGWRALLAVVALVLALAWIPAKAAEPEYLCGPGEPDASRFWLVMDASGLAVPWFCKQGDGWVATGFYGHWGELPGDWMYQATELLQMSKAERAALWKQYVKDPTPGADYTTISALYRDLIASKRAQYPAPTPVVTAPVLKLVVQNASKLVVGDRPVYKLNGDGTRNTTAIKGVRVAGGNTCDRNKHVGNYYSVKDYLDTKGYRIGDFYAACEWVPVK